MLFRSSDEGIYGFLSSLRKYQDCEPDFNDQIIQKILHNWETETIYNLFQFDQGDDIDETKKNIHDNLVVITSMIEDEKVCPLIEVSMIVVYFFNQVQLNL